MNQDLDSRAVAFIQAAKEQGYSRQEVCDRLYVHFLNGNKYPGISQVLTASHKVEQLMDPLWPEETLIAVLKTLKQESLWDAADTHVMCGADPDKVADAMLMMHAGGGQ